VKTKDLIAQLQREDPSGELECCVGNEDIYLVERLPSYYDGDLKFALERELRELDTLIKAAKKTSKSAVALAEKLEAQKQIKTLEAKRNNKRRQLFEAQDDVDRKRAELIEEIERQLQTKTSIKPVFTLRWTLGDGAGTTA